MKKSFFGLVVIVIGTLTLVSCDPKENVNSMVEKAWTFSHSRESLTFVVEHALNHDGYVGGWLDSENGQKAVYIISTGKEILVEEIRMAA